MPRKFNHTRAAAALVEAQLKGDREVAAAFGVSIRSIESWRARLEWDDQLKAEYEKLAPAKTIQWQSRIPDVLDKAIAFLGQTFEKGDPTNPELVKSVTAAIATLNEVAIVQAVITKKEQSRNSP